MRSIQTVRFRHSPLGVPCGACEGHTHTIGGITSAPSGPLSSHHGPVTRGTIVVGRLVNGR